ncbi:class I SAM-dependent methyltransferase [Methylobacterium iners]|uniref:Methyltransferase type 12 n=1 Tax=Methylobacterium iners TaxID=418707 RepID=A0ABQ4S118_9HYPH|nr:class I SAM-dependent methyltransferase [Methylobacterium iners]GJD95867.1 hypothetical protein OCOJLMKI_3083 [Methylobacterium iners]
MAAGAASLNGAHNRLNAFASLREYAYPDAAGKRFAATVSEALHPVVADDVGRAFDAILELGTAQDYTKVTDAVIDLLGLLKDTFSDKTWREAVLPAARGHAVAGLVHECPFTRHSFTKPRGYPGDAGLLDFVYRHPAATAAREAATDAGRTVMTLTVDVTACEAVRARRSILAAKIDEAADRREAPSILAVASGHLREAELSMALRKGRVGRLLAIDQDPLSLATVDKYSTSISAAVETKQVNVRSILAGKTDLGRFDLVYAAGLYDYLEEKVAARLTRVLFDHLNEGGRLLIPNFLWGVREEAYMEVFMDWYLLYRTRQEVEDFARELVPAEVRKIAYTEDASGVIGYLEVERA